MSGIRTKLVALGIGVLFSLLVPISLSFRAFSSPSGEDVLLRLNTACGQATECVYQRQYICSTFNQDWQDYKCSANCGADELVP